MKYDFNEGTVTHVQSMIIDLEVKIRVEENTCDFLNEQIEVFKKNLETAESIEKISLKSKIKELYKELEDAEVRCDALERQQRFYKDELAKGYIDVVELKQ